MLLSLRALAIASQVYALVVLCCLPCIFVHFGRTGRRPGQSETLEQGVVPAGNIPDETPGSSAKAPYQRDAAAAPAYADPSP